MKTLGLMVFVLGMLSAVSLVPDRAKCKLDLGLVVDRTRSIKYKNIPKLKLALSHLVHRFDISEDETHVSFATFAGRAKLHNKFKDTAYRNANAVIHLINSTIMKLGRPTRLDRALKLAKHRMFTQGNGLRNGNKTMVLYTDGKSHPKTLNYTQDVEGLKNLNVRVIVVGIGPKAQKPKYRLVLEKIAGENLFFVDDYDSLDDHTDGLVKLICHSIPPLPCQHAMDLGIIIDRSGSVGSANFDKTKNFVHTLVRRLQISSNGNRVGIIAYQSVTELVVKFADVNSQAPSAMTNIINGIRFTGGGTRTDRALEKADSGLFSSAGGDRGDKPNVLMVITDGRTNRGSKPYPRVLAPLIGKKVTMIAIGVGSGINYSELKEIANGKLANVIHVDKFDDLFVKLNSVLQASCEAE